MCLHGLWPRLPCRTCCPCRTCHPSAPVLVAALALGLLHVARGAAVLEGPEPLGTECGGSQELHGLPWSWRLIGTGLVALRRALLDWARVGWAPRPPWGLLSQSGSPGRGLGDAGRWEDRFPVQEGRYRGFPNAPRPVALARHGGFSCFVFAVPSPGTSLERLLGGVPGARSVRRPAPGFS